MRTAGPKPTVAELDRYIAGSLRVQRNLKIGLMGGIVGGLGLWAWNGLVALSVFLTAVFTAGVGFYITGVRIQEWKQQRYELQRNG